MEAEKPICLALHLCESTYRDAAAGKSYLLGIMEGIRTPQIPYVAPVILVYFELTSARGEYELDVAIEREGSDEPVRTIVPRRTVTLEDPLQVYAVNAQVRGLAFNAPGRYWFKVRVNGMLLAQRSLIVRLVAPGASTRPPAAEVTRPPRSATDSPVDE
ncbi:MAG: hypothetical protein WBD40_11255 [Tepidisphaeraceae bacterium]